jgi:predicted TIM-barrel fold metal-dependent hydrolase
MPESQYRVFDAHFHVINRKYPLFPSNSYLPNEFTCTDYVDRVRNFHICGGAVVSGSFQGFDQTYLVAALEQLGSSFVGVTQLPRTVTDEEVLRLNATGVRAIRFNLKRGGSEAVRYIDSVSRRIYDLAGWHTELYVSSEALPDLFDTLVALPSVSIDHLGLSGNGFGTLLKLAERGVYVKATGFGRVDFDIGSALRDIYAANPESLVFGTDLPSTRAPRPFEDRDMTLVIETLGSEAAKDVLWENAIRFYGLERSG